MDPARKLALFEQSILPHLNAAYNLARWLTRNGPDAEDMVQEAYLRVPFLRNLPKARTAKPGCWPWCAIPVLRC